MRLPGQVKEHPMSLAAPMAEQLASARSRRHVEVVRMSAIRLLKTRYRGTSLGVLWSFANPLLLTALYTTIFGTAFASYYGGSIARYVFSAFVGVAVVIFFSQATTEALTTVVGNGGLLNKIALDPETFPIAAIAANAFQQLTTTFPVVMLLSAFLTHDPIRVLLVPIVFAGVLLLCTGFGLTLATLYVFFRDLLYMWGIIGFVIWMTCPVFYPAALVPAGVRPWLTMNPVGMGIGALREVALGRGPVDYGLVGQFLAVAVACALIGHTIFRALQRDFMDLL
jgi:ABC-type polysaccharide/polyol phosphate export permease